MRELGEAKKLVSSANQMLLPGPCNTHTHTQTAAPGLGLVRWCNLSKVIEQVALLRTRITATMSHRYSTVELAPREKKYIYT
jgi:cytosine/adenosine deaminase-related metal-dependent hydrolase